MFKKFLILTILISVSCFLYGIYNIFIEVEQNRCRMTYMFAPPKYSRVHVNGNKNFTNYGLYYYYEGYENRDINNLWITGAPVIFVPGNAASHKQVRSLASVALRKYMDSKNRNHFDYFTIDTNEEFSAFYGGYLERQKQFLKISIEAILNLYKNRAKEQRKVVIIGHSMGGKIAQSLLADNDDIAKSINTIIFISSPLDKPVVYFDSEMNRFYKETNDQLLKLRLIHASNNYTNCCKNGKHNDYNKTQVDDLGKANLQDVLLISTGGGNRDSLVNAALTASKFNDIHMMTSSIPKVWLSCDHLSAVWCLQYVLVINRFLYSITDIDKDSYTIFNNNKKTRLQLAQNYFIRPHVRSKSIEDFKRSDDVNIWNEESKRVFQKPIKNGSKTYYNQLLILDKYQDYRKLYIDVHNVDDNNWLYGCIGIKTEAGKTLCEQGISLSHYINNIPTSFKERSIALLDLINIRKTYPQWTHILLRFKSNENFIHFNVDVHNPLERNINLKSPKVFAYKPKPIINETLQGTAYLKLQIKELDKPYQAIQFDIVAHDCRVTKYEIVAKICVPWSPGFERFERLSEIVDSFFVNVDTNSPPGYNTTNNPVTVEFYLDPICRYSISYKYSIADSTSRIVHQFYHWLPAHLVCVLIIVLRNQLNVVNDEKQSCFHNSKIYRPYFQYASVLLVAACRIFKKFLLTFKFLPPIDNITPSFVISAIIQCTAIILSIVLIFLIWIILTVQANFLYTVISRLTKLTNYTSSLLTSLMTHLPISFGILFVSFAMASCSGAALTVSSIFYFLMLSNAYKDYHEDLAWKMFTKFFKSLFKRKSQKNDESIIEPAVQRTDEESNTVKKVEKLEGLQCFGFHTTLLMLLMIMAGINFAVTIAWIQGYRNGPLQMDPSLLSGIVVLMSLSALLQLKAPHQISNSRLISFVLYCCAAFSIIYCQESFHRLNYVIATVFISILCHELYCHIFKKSHQQIE